MNFICAENDPDYNLSSRVLLNISTQFFLADKLNGFDGCRIGCVYRVARVVLQRISIASVRIAVEDSRFAFT